MWRCRPGKKTKGDRRVVFVQEVIVEEEMTGGRCTAVGTSSVGPSLCLYGYNAPVQRRVKNETQGRVRRCSSSSVSAPISNSIQLAASILREAGSKSVNCNH